MKKGKVEISIKQRNAGIQKRDASFDNGIIVHEYAHGISNRMTAGRFNTGCLSNVEQAGEGPRLFLPAACEDGVLLAELDLFTNLPRSYYCLVVAVSGSHNPNDYTRAVALIRAEHPDLVRLSCIHEELAQGLGLSNDSPSARPSIFNDDDEFALLTSHDELLLKMLYDPRLKQGMTADEARPITGMIARELMGQEL